MRASPVTQASEGYHLRQQAFAALIKWAMKAECVCVPRDPGATVPPADVGGTSAVDVGGFVHIVGEAIANSENALNVVSLRSVNTYAPASSWTLADTRVPLCSSRMRV